MFDETSETVACAPGRVNLVGGHTDYNDGFVLPVGVDRRTAVAGRSRTDDRVAVYSDALNQTRTVDDDAADVAGLLADTYRKGVGTEPEVYVCDPSPGAYAPSASST